MADLRKLVAAKHCLNCTDGSSSLYHQPRNPVLGDLDARGQRIDRWMFQRFSAL